ncbi:ATP-binding cassette domain-containing protein [Nocardiopsis sp. HNM0947]|uniref:ATP-binding cassette domain-containing protein n=1 Tax=Nocardiopsis coralli TaxID=2772213 RepID=A0ABR9PEN0_9ACTN|nr:ATP-binding cassette domain-containing protein [Nocardiopsis coralli]MBE3002309.1 ATP-binding cassette domain-containing protein [Nocardiopsis coralli]
MISIDGVSKTYGKARAVENVGFTAEPGAVTGLIGPNGSGKSTTLRILLGITRPDTGTATVGGSRYRDLAFPLRTVGALLDNAAPLPERRAVDHLTWIARSNGIPKVRAREVLDAVGLSRAAKDRVKSYSLGMRQRLGIAAALLGDPDIIVLDEPMNGLDPEGIRWIRDLMRERADAGGTVLVSSHFMKELESVADHAVLLAGGRVRASGALGDIVAGYPSLEEAYFDLTREAAR